MKFEVGKYYRTRDGDRVCLVGKAKNGKLIFQFDDEEFCITNQIGVCFGIGKTCFDIVSEWKEPHKYETAVWLDTYTDNNFWLSDIFGLPCGGYSLKKSGFCNRQFKITVEEII